MRRQEGKKYLHKCLGVIACPLLKVAALLKPPSPGNGGANAILCARISRCIENNKNLPSVNLIKYGVCLGFSMFALKILSYPVNKVVFKDTLDQLVKNVWGY